MSILIQNSIIKILDTNGLTLGSGFLASKNGHVLTCSHVILNEQQQIQGVKPPDEIQVSFINNPIVFKARVLQEYWKGFNEGDLAVLLIEQEVPDDIKPLPIGSSENSNFKKNSIKTYGFPNVKFIKGMQGSGFVFSDKTPSESSDYDLLQLDDCSQITRGFSGSPIFNEDTGNIIGIISWITIPDKFDRLQKTAFGISSEFIISICPELPFINSFAISESIWEGTRRYYNYLKDTRYKYLKISDLILTKTSDYLETTIKLGDKDLPLLNSIQRLWNSPNKHAVILGEGGMGKTVSIIRLWESYLEQSDERSNLNSYFYKPIPIFLALSEFNSINEKDRDSFIINSIGKKYLGYKSLGSDLLEQIELLLKKPLVDAGGEFCPSLILFLDGFNEVTVPKDSLIRQLSQIVEKYKGVQVVVSSRYDLRNFSWATSFVLLELQPLEEEQIHEFLSIAKAVKPKTVRLKKLIRNPMNLTLYAAVSEIMEKYKEDDRFYFKKEINTTGELMWNFIEAQIVKKFTSKGDEYSEGEIIDDFLVDYYRFLFRNLLPFIGFNMEKDGAFEASRKLLRETINRFYENFDSHSYLENFSERFKKIASTLLRELLIIVQEESSFRFLHQNFRDYFSACYHINEMMLCSINSNEISCMQQRYISSYIRKIIGEIEEEHYNMVAWENENWQIEFQNSLLYKSLNIYRDKFSEEASLAVWNILTILNEQRQELSGFDLSHLDLSKVSFNNIRLSRSSGDKYFAANFNGSKLNIDGFVFNGHNNNMTMATYTPIKNVVATGAVDGKIKFWDLNTGVCLRTFEGHHSFIKAINFSQDGLKMVTASCDPNIKEWDVKSGNCLQTYPGHIHEVIWAEYSKDGNKIISCGLDNLIKEWDTLSGNCIKEFTAHSSPCNRVLYSPCNTKVLSCGSRWVEEWDVKTGECLMTYKGHNEVINSIAYNLQGDRILSASMDNTVKEWDTKTGTCIRTISDEKEMATEVIYDEKNNRIIIGYGDGSIGEYDISSVELLQKIQVHGTITNFLHLNPDTNTILSSCYIENAVIEWDLGTGESLSSLHTSSKLPNRATYCKKTGKVLSASGGGKIKEWYLDSGQCLHIYDGHTDRAVFSIYDPTNTKILSTSWDRTIKEWDVQSGKLIRTYIDDVGESFTRLSYSSSGDKILAGSSNSCIYEWSTKTGEIIRKYEGHTRRVRSACYSKDENYIISSSEDGTIKLWNTSTGKCMEIVKEEICSRPFAIFHPNKTSVIGWLHEEVLKEWDILTGKVIRRFEGHTSSLESLDISPDKSKIITGSYDNTIREWDLHSGECIKIYKGHQYWVSNAEYNQDGSLIISSSSDFTIREWDVKTGKCLKIITDFDGVIIQGCSFKNIKFDERNEQTLGIMKMHGAFFDEEDKNRWNQWTKKRKAQYKIEAEDQNSISDGGQGASDDLPPGAGR